MKQKQTRAKWAKGVKQYEAQFSQSKVGAITPWSKPGKCEKKMKKKMRAVQKLTIFYLCISDSNFLNNNTSCLVWFGIQIVASGLKQ
jgi:hypothetical protein